jgi:hypothetical protein
MIRRILPLVMMLTIALGPVALDVCQMACAEHGHAAVAASVPATHHHHAEPGDGTVAHHHVDHAASAAAAGTASRIPAYTGTAPRTPACTVRGGPHGCLHGEELPAFVGANLQIALAPVAVVLTRFELPGPTSGTRTLSDSNSVLHAPSIAHTTQLRV